MNEVKQFSTPRETAEFLMGAAISFVPVRIDGSKSASVDWKQYQLRMPTADEVRGWFGNGASRGIATICGDVSGGLEVVDLDAPHLREEFESLVRETAPGLLERLLVVQTPKGGRHYGFRSGAVQKNQKLARRKVGDEIKVTIETRGEGGYVVAPGSPDRCHPLNKPYVVLQGGYLSIPRLTAEERAILLDCARSFNEIVQEVKGHHEPRPHSENGTRPGEDFNARSGADTVAEMLSNAGWKSINRRSKYGQMWRRPGKTDPGASATLCDNGALSVFSTNAYPFEVDKSYSPFAVLALTQFNGDFQACAKTLAAQGFGDQTKKREEPPAKEEAPAAFVKTPELTGDQAHETVLNLDAKVRERAAYGLTPEVFAAALWLREHEIAEYYDLEKVIKKSGSIPIAQWRAQLEKFEMEKVLAERRDRPAPPKKDLESVIERAQDVFAPIDRDRLGAVDTRIIFDGAETQDPLPLAAEVWKALAKSEGDIPTFFWHNDILSRLDIEEGIVKLRPVSRDRFSNRLAHLAKWERFSEKKGVYYVPPPSMLITQMLADPPASTPIPILNRVVTAPVFARDGRLIIEPGFDRPSGIYFLPTFETIPVPESATEEHAKEALKLLTDELLYDFPFATNADRDNAIGLFLLPFIRDMVDGPTPLHVVEAAVEGTGKGMLLDSLLCPVLGKTGISTIEYTTNPEELSKKITTTLMAAKGAIVFGNVNDKVDSGWLSDTLTQDRYTGRILGLSQNAEIVIRNVWAMTANNPEFSGEMSRRVVSIRLVAKTDNPSARTGFRHRLPRWAIDNRARLANAAHVLTLRWIQAGRPKRRQVPPGAETLGSFESWVDLLGGILELAGCPDFLANLRRNRDRIDVARQARAYLCYQWFKRFPSADGSSTVPIKAGELWDAVARDVEGLEVSGKDENGKRASFAKYLARKCVDVYPEYSGPQFDKQDPSDPEPPHVSYRFHVQTRGNGNHKKWYLEIEQANPPVPASPTPQPSACSVCGASLTSGGCPACDRPLPF